MPTNKSFADVRDFARFIFKTYQGLIYAALLKDDQQFLENVASEFYRALKYSLDDEGVLRVRISILKQEIQRSQREADHNAQIEKLAHDLEKLEAEQNLQLARRQIFFGLAAFALETQIKSPSPEKLKAAQFLMTYLPDSFSNLISVLSSIVDNNFSDPWGWDWWDIKTDGEVHTIDSFSRVSGAFIVKALQILTGNENAAALIVPENMIYQLAPNNPKGLIAALAAVEENRESYTQILAPKQLANIKRLRNLLKEMKDKAENERETRLQEENLDPGKIREFRGNVLRAFNRSSQLRTIFAQRAQVKDKSHMVAPNELKAIGFNQLDEKGAFIANWHVHFSKWGETYGRGLAQAENTRTFETLVAKAHERKAISRRNLIKEILTSIKSSGWADPVILHLHSQTLNLSHWNAQKEFTSKYHKTRENSISENIDSFIGVLNIEDLSIPVFNIFSHKREEQDTVLITDIRRYAIWNRYRPIEDREFDDDIADLLQVSVFDLNVDEKRRTQILRDKPNWLLAKGGRSAQEKFLKSHVVVNIYDKFEIEVLNQFAAICLEIVEDKRNEPVER